MRTNLRLTCGAVVVALAVGRPAHAADWFTLLDWACDPNDTNTKAVKDMVLTACGVTEGEKKTCDVVKGTPFACFSTASAARDKKSCDKSKITFEISAETSQTLGWKIEGKLNVEAEYALYWDTAQECTLTPKSPVPTAEGGEYVFKTGTAKAVGIFIASGEGKVTFLGGTVFSESVTKKCAKDLSMTVYKNATASGCTGPPPTPTPKDSPTPTASATPTDTPQDPTPTETATPWPTAAPTAEVTPWPTAVEAF